MRLCAIFSVDPQHVSLLGPLAEPICGWLLDEAEVGGVWSSSEGGVWQRSHLQGHADLTLVWKAGLVLGYQERKAEVVA